MNIEIFKKALGYYYGGQVQQWEETPKSMWFKVDGEEVRFEYGDGFLKVTCTCEFCGKKGIAKGALCSRKIASLMWLDHQFIRKAVEKEKHEQEKLEKKRD